MAAKTHGVQRGPLSCLCGPLTARRGGGGGNDDMTGGASCPPIPPQKRHVAGQRGGVNVGDVVSGSPNFQIETTAPLRNRSAGTPHRTFGFMYTKSEERGYNNGAGWCRYAQNRRIVQRWGPGPGRVPVGTSVCTHFGLRKKSPPFFVPRTLGQRHFGGRGPLSLSSRVLLPLDVPLMQRGWRRGGGGAQAPTSRGGTAPRTQLDRMAQTQFRAHLTHRQPPTFGGLHPSKLP